MTHPSDGDYDPVTGGRVKSAWEVERDARRREGASFTCHLETRMNKFGEPVR